MTVVLAAIKINDFLIDGEQQNLASLFGCLMKLDWAKMMGVTEIEKKLPMLFLLLALSGGVKSNTITDKCGHKRLKSPL